MIDMAKDEHDARFLFVINMYRNSYEIWIFFFVFDETFICLPRIYDYEPKEGFLC
ncbi:hypothetical protein FB550_10284 [Neobacillus bataviensis]|uniref:Uncharacterized protein n=1 Tax=Neobacillus bataviensis TaxID=220685 RepID=A0A561DRQ8_9BACI|nr:hypothetical protein FB550_10284 [Neobacillus bataviensis]